MEEIISQVEKKWLHLLYRTISIEFTDVPVPSHDHTHHLRAWIFAKELVIALYKSGISFTYSEIEGLIVAVFFHDVGLTRTLKPAHGYESRKICKDFFIRNPSLRIDNANEVLDAIEMHDDKTYVSGPRNKVSIIHTLLSISDDLDAYGAIGVYRYLEIYLLRGENLYEIPAKVINNLDSRFKFLEVKFGNLKEYVLSQLQRKQITQNFYYSLLEDIKKGGGESSEKGAIYITNLLIDHFIIPKINILELLKMKFMVKTSDPFVNAFFNLLSDELQKLSKEITT